MEPSGASSPDAWNIMKGTAVGGLLVSSFCVPTDVVRNYWYFNPELKERRGSMSTLGVARHLYSTRGLRCFFTGFQLSAVNIVAGQTIFLVTYESLKGSMSTPMASVLGRMATLLSMQPMECLRTFKQANLSQSTRSFFRDRRGMSAFLSLYKGLAPTVIRDVPFSALHWPMNDFIYHRILSCRQRPAESLTKREKVALSFLTGATSSMVATVMSQPFDIVKTKIQASADMETNMTVCGELRRFFGQYGAKGFLIGLTPRLFKVVPGCAIISGCHRYFN